MGEVIDLEYKRLLRDIADMKEAIRDPGNDNFHVHAYRCNFNGDLECDCGHILGEERW